MCSEIAPHLPMAIHQGCPRVVQRGRAPSGRRGFRKARRGFSLVELMVVMVIIGLLASLVVFRTRTYLITSKQNAAKAEIARMVQALETFYTVYDRYPTNDEGLEALVTPTDELPDGILNKVPIDPWKHEYQYNNPGRNAAFEVICLGVDGREGGDKAARDISSDDLDD